MNSINKNIVLLLGHNVWQRRALTLTLRLGAYEAHIVNDVHEAINIVKMMPESVHSIVLSGVGCQTTLKETLQAFSENHVSTPVFLVGISTSDLKRNKIPDLAENQLKLSSCRNDQLLEYLEQ